jgi:hypothetical protein
MKTEEREQLKHEIVTQSRAAAERATKLINELATKTASLKRDVKNLKANLSDEVAQIQT